jgi:hypothetical protein
LAVSNGGTGSSLFASGRLLIGQGTSAITTDTLHWDTVNNRLGINTITPDYSLHVSGDINFTGSVLSNGSIWTPLPSILSDTTESVLYVGGKHHN